MGRSLNTEIQRGAIIAGVLDTVTPAALLRNSGGCHLFIYLFIGLRFNFDQMSHLLFK